MKKEIIKFDNVAIGYGKNIIAEAINFSVYENDFIGLVGPNGAGKTTLLKTLLGVLKPLKGIITREGFVPGYVPQRDTIQPLLPYTVEDVVTMGRYPMLGLFKNPGKEDRMIVEEAIESVNLGGVMHERYNSLSGGQRQRTLIARALAAQPNVLILDEPTNGMDTPSHYALLSLISELHCCKNLTVFLVSHLLSDVANVVRRLILLDRKHFQAGNIEDVLSEENLKRTYSEDFIVAKINDEYLITSKHRK